MAYLVNRFGASQEDTSAVSQSGYWDRGYYEGRNPDVVAAGVVPIHHFIDNGGRRPERRDPGPYFSTDYYFRHNQDVWNAGVNALLHYVRYGKNEGRAIASVAQNAAELAPPPPVVTPPPAPTGPTQAEIDLAVAQQAQRDAEIRAAAAEAERQRQVAAARTEQEAALAAAREQAAAQAAALQAQIDQQRAAMEYLDAMRRQSSDADERAAIEAERAKLQEELDTLARGAAEATAVATGQATPASTATPAAPGPAVSPLLIGGALIAGLLLL